MFDNQCGPRRHGRPEGPGFGRGHGHGPGPGPEPDMQHGRPGMGHMGGHARGFGGGHGFGPGYGPGFVPPFGFGPGRGRGSGVRRGDVKDAILTALAAEPMHGYGVIQKLTEMSGGRWRPSAGSIYPTLQQLEDEGLVVAEERDGRRVFVLTETGRAAAVDAGTRGGPRWDSDTAGDAAGGSSPSGAPSASEELRDAFNQLGAAVSQTAQFGTPQSRTATKTILADARKAIYRLLAEEDDDVRP